MAVWGDEPTDGSAIATLLERSRLDLDRVEPAELERVRAAGALVVDVRPIDQRQRDGELPGSVVVDRNVLEWRLDPTCPHRLPEAGDPFRRIVVVCDEGYSSSLAAWTLLRLGLPNATDLRGGFQAWLRWRGQAEDRVTVTSEVSRAVSAASSDMGTAGGGTSGRRASAGP